jgi:AcrR family transcriptional regulator
LGAGIEVPIRAALIDATIAELAGYGLEAVSLRRVAAAVGRSTTAIFQHFGGKAGMLGASLEVALDRDCAFHEGLSDEVDGLALDHPALVSLIALYIEQLATDPSARIWREILFKSAQLAAPPLLLERWHAMRVAFWQRVCAGTPASATLAPLLTAFTAMEESYAQNLSDDVGYALVLRETIGRLLDATFDRAAAPSDPVSTWLQTHVSAPPAPERKGDAVLGDTLLDLAAREIFQHGVSALNHRRLTALAGASPAMIIYHFGDMATFTTAAIWQALMQGLPAYLQRDETRGATLATMEDWAASLGKTVSRSASGPSAGFYIGYARIVGQVCLLARREPALVPLVRYLRAIEGSGVHRASQFSWPEALRMGRANAGGFAIWIKGFAILNEALARDGGEPAALIDAAHRLVAHR